jgi:hypothetical protein
MRKARQWFATFSAQTPADMPPMGSQENAYLRMVTSYWDMAAAFVTSGVLNEDLFLQTNGNLEIVGNAAIKRMPAEAYQAFSNMVKGVAAAGR